VLISAVKRPLPHPASKFHFFRLRNSRSSSAQLNPLWAEIQLQISKALSSFSGSQVIISFPLILKVSFCITHKRFPIKLKTTPGSPYSASFYKDRYRFGLFFHYHAIEESIFWLSFAFPAFRPGGSNNIQEPPAIPSNYKK